MDVLGREIVVSAPQTTDLLRASGWCCVGCQYDPRMLRLAETELGGYAAVLGILRRGYRPMRCKM